MKNNKKTIFTIIFFTVAFFSWRLFLKPEIVGVHQDRYLTFIVMKNPPLTDKGKINWWVKNKQKLKEEYSIPKPDSEGYYDISFWNVGDGYKINHGTDEDADLLCFSALKTKEKCIKKNPVLFITHYSKNNDKGPFTQFTLKNVIYRQHGENGEIKRVKDEE
ncbi:DUF943 family protein [Nissabacter archeti]|uniref:DUF943 family protein n=1 Tax=Nissabacter archeti TaxID=1917880 RepID=A0ABS5JHX6_9GAMM|nr:DUF943 family protein [Nissabacter archeti]MBS0969576.1 DUF943 family protein [Nissabacter archeti]